MKVPRPLWAWPIGPGPCVLRQDGVMEPGGSFSESQDPFPWTPQGEAWTEAASWIAEERRARLHGDPTEEAFARLAFELCVRQTQDLEPG